MDTINQETASQLRSIIERIEQLDSERRETVEGIKDVYTEAKSAGFDVYAVRKIIAMRRRSKDEIAQQEAILETYMHALGMV